MDIDNNNIIYLVKIKQTLKLKNIYKYGSTINTINNSNVYNIQVNNINYILNLIDAILYYKLDNISQTIEINDIIIKYIFNYISHNFIPNELYHKFNIINNNLLNKDKETLCNLIPMKYWNNLLLYSMNLDKKFIYTINPQLNYRDNFYYYIIQYEEFLYNNECIFFYTKLYEYSQINKLIYNNQCNLNINHLMILYHKYKEFKNNINCLKLEDIMIYINNIKNLKNYIILI